MGTWRGGLMPSVISVYAESWDIAGMTFVSSRRLLRETDSTFITCIVRQRQLQLHGHVACFPEADPAHRVASVRDNPEWRRPWGRPRSSWHEQVDRFCRKVLRFGRGPALRLAWRDPLAWHCGMGETTRPSAYAPIDWFTDQYRLIYIREIIV